MIGAQPMDPLSQITSLLNAQRNVGLLHSQIAGSTSQSDTKLEEVSRKLEVSTSFEAATERDAFKKLELSKSSETITSASKKPEPSQQKVDLLKMIEAATRVFGTPEQPKERHSILKKGSTKETEKQNGEAAPDLDRIADMELEASLRQPPKQPSPEVIAVEPKPQEEIPQSAFAKNNRENVRTQMMYFCNYIRIHYC